MPSWPHKLGARKAREGIHTRTYLRSNRNCMPREDHILYYSCTRVYLVAGLRVLMRRTLTSARLFVVVVSRKALGSTIDKVLSLSVIISM